MKFETTGAREPSLAQFCLLFAAVFAVSFAINSIGIAFPIYWHPDELSKAAQIENGKLNFYHPQLMLLLVKLLDTFLPLDDARTIILTGRTVSAAAAATAVALLAIVAARRFGILIGIITAILVGTTPIVFVNAHFFKEDAMLLLGCSLVLLSLQTFDLRPARPSAAFVGICIGIASSAKYVGVLMLIPAFIMIAQKRSGWVYQMIALACAASIFVLINAAGIFGSSSLLNGLTTELRHVTSEHSGVQYGPTSAATLTFFLRSTAAGFVLLWLVGLSYCCWTLVSKERAANVGYALSTFETSLYVTPLLFLVIVQMSMAVVPRYLMPAAAMVTLAAVWTAARLLMENRTRLKSAITAVLFVIGAAGTVAPFLASLSVFTDPPRMNVANWISSNLPPTAKIAADFYSGIPDRRFAELDPTSPAMPQTVMISKIIADETIETLREAGFTHIVASGGNYDRFFSLSGTLASPASERRKQHYEDVFTNLRMIYDQPARTDIDALFDARISIFEIQSIPSQNRLSAD